jgi:hypothetical protein
MLQISFLFYLIKKRAYWVGTYNEDGYLGRIEITDLNKEPNNYIILAFTGIMKNDKNQEENTIGIIDLKNNKLQIVESDLKPKIDYLSFQSHFINPDLSLLD